MNKLLKVLFAFVFMFTMAFTNQTPIQAQEEQPVSTTTETASIVPYARVCICGNGTYNLVSTSYGGWVTKSQVKCTHHNWGTDLVQNRSVYKTYRCNSCGRGYDSTSTERRTLCHGYDK